MLSDGTWFPHCWNHRGHWTALPVFEFSVATNSPDPIFIFCRTISWQVLEERILLITNICRTWPCCTLASDVEKQIMCTTVVPYRHACMNSLLIAIFSGPYEDYRVLKGRQIKLWLTEGQMTCQDVLANTIFLLLFIVRQLPLSVFFRSFT